MLQQDTTSDKAIHKLSQQQKLKYLLCRAIQFGTVKEVQRFRWFKDTIEDTPNTDKKKFIPLEVTLALIMIFRPI